MNDAENELKKIIDEVNPKHISITVKKNRELYNIIENYTGNSISEKIYNYLNPNKNICKYLQTKKFKSLSDGYQNCGRASQCRCTNESVSQKVSCAKKSYSKEANQIINEKRNETTLLRYNVNNNGQILKSKEAHAEFYNDKNNVAAVTKQIKATKLSKYGNENYNNIEQIKETLSNKFTDDYIVDRYKNENLVLLRNKNKLKKLYKKKTAYEIANDLSVHVQTVFRYLNMYKLREPYKSQGEREVEHFLKSVGVKNIITNTRKLLPNNKEIDIYLPDYKVAIEYNGVYWHHEDIAHINKYYHYSKYQECVKLGIQLISIYSIDWEHRKEIVKRSLLAKLKLNKSYISARKCTIKEVNGTESGAFLNEFHIQGNTSSTYKYGLFYNDELVSLMTFSKKRVGIGEKTTDAEGKFELVRYASSKHVVGGASRLLTHFIRNHFTKLIYSYSDNEWSDGNLYSVLGFELLRENKPSYWYYKPNNKKMNHRYTYSKQKLRDKGFDVTETEKNITKYDLGLLKIWDCGKKTWVLKVDK